MGCYLPVVHGCASLDFGVRNSFSALRRILATNTLVKEKVFVFARASAVVT